MKVIFLDWDGVLSPLRLNNELVRVEPSCVANLNRILSDRSVKIVISSSWRYYIFQNEMSLFGFEVMMRSHGIDCLGRVIGHTRVEKLSEYNLRGNLICEWLKEHDDVDRYVVLDDWDLGISSCGLNFVQTDSYVGLTEQDAAKAIEVLSG